MKNCAVKITAFQEKVYRAVKMIPKGRVSSYSIIAYIIGCRSARAVGQALKKNSFAPFVPCHRVISSNLEIGGFMGDIKGRSIKKKKNLLRSEGIKFDKGNRVKSEYLWIPGGLNQKLYRRVR